MLIPIYIKLGLNKVAKISLNFDTSQWHPIQYLYICNSDCIQVKCVDLLVLCTGNFLLSKSDVKALVFVRVFNLREFS